MPDLPERSFLDNTRHEEFVSLLVANQPRLHSFLRSLLPTWADVDAVMQETSLVAWRKFDRYEKGTNFMAWVAAIARFEALDYMRQRGRERLMFSDDVVALMADETLAEEKHLKREREALDDCLEKLNAGQRELLLLSYQPGTRFHEVAAKAGRSVQGYYKLLQRLRRLLLECIRQQMRKE